MNRGDRVTEYLDFRAASNIVEGVRFAVELREAPNQFISIHLDKLWVRRPQRFVTQFMKEMGGWLAYRKIALVYAWVLENPPNGGFHLHVMALFPAGFSLPMDLAVAWAEKAGAVVPNASDGIVVQPITDLQGLVGYFLKGADEETMERLRSDYGVYRTPEFQGRISGKRCGVSEQIDRAARKKALISRLRQLAKEYLAAEAKRRGAGPKRYGNKPGRPYSAPVDTRLRYRRSKKAAA